MNPERFSHKVDWVFHTRCHLSTMVECLYVISIKAFTIWRFSGT